MTKKNLILQEIKELKHVVFPIMTTIGLLMVFLPLIGQAQALANGNPIVTSYTEALEGLVIAVSGWILGYSAEIVWASSNKEVMLYGK